MRRKDREITDLETIYKIMDNCTCCRLGFYDETEGEVYILPLNFGYEVENGITTLYFHGAKVGRKIDLINKVKSVGFEMDTQYELIKGEMACDYTAKYQSIIGSGTISLVDDLIEKELGLHKIMYQNTKKSDWRFKLSMLDRVAVFKVEVKKMACKVHE